MLERYIYIILDSHSIASYYIYIYDLIMKWHVRIFYYENKYYIMPQIKFMNETLKRSRFLTMKILSFVYLKQNQTLPLLYHLRIF